MKMLKMTLILSLLELVASIGHLILDLAYFLLLSPIGTTFRLFVVPNPFVVVIFDLNWLHIFISRFDEIPLQIANEM